MRPAVFLHVATAVVWIGALAPLGLATWRGEAGATAALRRFSRAIPALVAVLVLAGAALAAVQVGRPSALLDTAYGQVFLVKLAALVALFGLAAVNRWTLTTPSLAGDGEARRRLSRSIGAETLLALAILGAVAVWRFTPPPRVLAAEAAMPVTVELQSANAAVLLWIGPARAGPVDIVANVLGPDFGPLEPESVSVTLSGPGDDPTPSSRALARGAGMADWHAGGLVIPRPGLWRVRVDLRIAGSGTESLEGEVRIRP
jgi:copper transport protein